MATEIQDTLVSTNVASRYGVSYLGDLNTPVEQQLGANVVFVFMNIVQQTAMGHELSDQLYGGAQTHSQ